MFAHLRHRLNFLVILLAIAASLLVLRLAYVQIVRADELRELAEEERVRLLTLEEPPRGLIYDRDGFLLTVNEPRYAIGANPSFVKNIGLAAERLAPILHLPSRAISTTLLLAREKEEPWVVLELYATPEQGEAVQDLGLQGIDARLHWIRRYPHGSLAAHLLGFVSRSGEGFYGLEGSCDDKLGAEAPQWEGETGPSGRLPLPQEEGTVPPPAAGSDLVLTLDLAVQQVVEGELARAADEFGAESGTVIVMDPNTGAILAMASWPAFDPDLHEWYIYWDLEAVFTNPAVRDAYEPGSIFKIITVAAALDSGTCTPDYTYVDTGEIEVAGQVFTNWDGKAYGERDLADMLGYSLNVGTVGLAVEAGQDTFYRYLRAFGFGRTTEVDLQGEVTGDVRVPGDLRWRDSDLGAHAFGQGLTVTPIQMISAVGAVANGGRLMRPHLVARQVQPDGSVIESQAVVRGHPISEQTARALSEILVQAVERRLPKARVPGYRVAGKTGTAQIPIPGGYDPRWTIASFVGFGPVPDPQLVILVRLDRPQTSPWASETAALVFQRLASRLFLMLGIPPEG